MLFVERLNNDEPDRSIKSSADLLPNVRPVLAVEKFSVIELMVISKEVMLPGIAFPKKFPPDISKLLME